MKEINYQSFRSGSDIRGIATGENVSLTNDIVKNISISFALFIEKFENIDIKNQVIAIGHDSRLSSVQFYEIFLNSLSSIGVTTYACGLCSTPAMSSSFKFLSCCASVEITASHHPKEYNGFKFFVKNKGLSSIDIMELLKISETEFYPKSSSIGTVHEFDLMRCYSEDLKNKIKDSLHNEKPLKGFHIVVDASNGAGGFFVKDVLNPLGADTYGSKLLEPNGNFPEHSPNPEKKDSIKSIVNASIQNKADLGIIFDADVDRCFFVDNKGNPIIKNKLIALISKFVLNEYPESTIVTDSVTSDHLKDFIEKNGGFQFRERRGYQHVISSAKDLNDANEQCHLAIETSGHAAFKENSFKDDGAFLAVKIIIEMAKLKQSKKNISDVLEGFIEAKESLERRIMFKTSEEINQKIQSVKDNYQKIENCFIDKDTPEGVRLNFTKDDRKGWCLIRQSAHDLSIVINIESDVTSGAKKIFKDIEQLTLTTKNNNDNI